MNKKTLIWLVVVAFIVVVGGITLYYKDSIFNYVTKTPVTTPNNIIVYKNTDYGFNFSLPLSWKGYLIVKTTWNGNALKNTIAPNGVKLIIRNPKWTEAVHYEDIPILVFTIKDWNSYLAEDFAVSAAPILATEFGRNNVYVFALPPRWNFDYSLGYEEADNIVKNKPLTTFDIDNKLSLECHDSSKYFAIQKSVADTVGSDILIKYKTAVGEKLPCVYKVEKNDFEIKNASAEYFLAFTNNFLVLDKGTAPEPRGLVVYDLRSRKIAFQDSYGKPVETKEDVITYWSKTTERPTVINCPDINSYTKNGLGAVIMSKVTVNLFLLDKKDTGTTKCMATQ